MVPHFKGKVIQVFGTAQRPKPSLVPLNVAGAALVGALVLPYLLAGIPLLILGLVAWMWLRRRGWVGGRRGARAPRPDAGLQVTSFRVRVLSDQPPYREFTTLDCRLVQRAEAGPPPLVGDENVTGRGHRFGGGMLEVKALSLGDGGTKLRSTPIKSAAHVAVPTLALLGSAGLVLWTEWDYIAGFDFERSVSSLASVLMPLLVMVVLFKFLARRAPWR